MDLKIGENNLPDEEENEVKPRRTVEGTCCRREGCTNELPIVGYAHGDPYCSTDCAKVAYGTVHLFQSAVADNSRPGRRKVF